MLVYLEITFSAAFFIIMLLLFGFVYTVIRGKTCSNIQKTIGSRGFLWLSFIGVPVHELSHYFACKLFGHRVDKVVLFSPKMWKQNGTMGFVNHSYNQKKISHLAGNFIIGVAPVISGAGISYLLMKFVFKNVSFISNFDDITLKKIVDLIKGLFLSILKIFSLKNLMNPLFWICLFVLINIFLHVSLSKEDFKNAAVGIIFFLIGVPLLSLVLTLASVSPDEFLVNCVKINTAFLVGLIFGLLLDLLLWGISIIGFKIKKIYYLKKKNLIIS